MIILQTWVPTIIKAFNVHFKTVADSTKLVMDSQPTGLQGLKEWAEIQYFGPLFTELDHYETLLALQVRIICNRVIEDNIYAPWELVDKFASQMGGISIEQLTDPPLCIHAGQVRVLPKGIVEKTSMQVTVVECDYHAVIELERVIVNAD